MIYLIRSYGDGGKSALKIGFASDLERRMSQYFYMNPFFKIISSREGDELLEDLLHYYLYYKGFQYKIDGKLNEWFIDDPEVIKVFDISIEDLEKELWENRDKVFDLKGKLKNSLDYKLFEYLYQKNKEDFIGEKYILDENNKIIETSAKDMDVIFWEIYSPDNFIVPLQDINLDPILEKEIDDFLDNHFYKTGIFEYKMKMYCEFMDKHNGSQGVSDSLYFRIKDDKYRRYYNFFGTSGCRASSYIESKLYSRMMNVSKESELSSIIHSKFKEGDRLIAGDIKKELQNIYRDLGITDKAKATDLSKYFKLSRTRITFPDKTVREGFKLESLL